MIVAFSSVSGKQDGDHGGRPPAPKLSHFQARPVFVGLKISRFLVSQRAPVVPAKQRGWNPPGIALTRRANAFDSEIMKLTRLYPALSEISIVEKNVSAAKSIASPAARFSVSHNLSRSSTAARSFDSLPMRGQTERRHMRIIIALRQVGRAWFFKKNAVRHIQVQSIDLRVAKFNLTRSAFTKCVADRPGRRARSPETPRR